MQVTRVSTYSSTTNTQEIDVTHEQLDAWRSGVSIQVAMPHLSADEREFIMTGITGEEWKKLFPPEPATVRGVTYPDGDKVFPANRRVHKMDAAVLHANNDFQEKIKNTCKEKGITQRKLSLAMGKNAAYIHQYVTNGTPRKLKFKDAVKAAEVLGLPATAFLTEELKKLLGLKKADNVSMSKTCSICNDKYIGFGNNAWPLNDGRCCDGCNGLVLLERLANIGLPIKALKLGKTASALLKRGN